MQHNERWIVFNQGADGFHHILLFSEKIPVDAGVGDKSRPGSFAGEQFEMAADRSSLRFTMEDGLAFSYELLERDWLHRRDILKIDSTEFHVEDGAVFLIELLPGGNVIEQLHVPLVRGVRDSDSPVIDEIEHLAKEHEAVRAFAGSEAGMAQ